MILKKIINYSLDVCVEHHTSINVNSYVQQCVVLYTTQAKE